MWVYTGASFFIDFRSVLARFDLHFPSIWLPLDAILAPFSSSLASIWPPWRRLGRVARNVHENRRFWSPFWLHFGTILAPKTNIFRLKNCIDFLIEFRNHFASILGAFLNHFWFQNRARIEKGDFVKMSVSLTRGAHFQGFRLPKSSQKSMKIRSKNRLLF